MDYYSRKRPRSKSPPSNHGPGRRQEQPWSRFDYQDRERGQGHSQTSSSSSASRGPQQATAPPPDHWNSDHHNSGNNGSNRGGGYYDDRRPNYQERDMMMRRGDTGGGGGGGNYGGNGMNEDDRWRSQGGGGGSSSNKRGRFDSGPSAPSSYDSSSTTSSTALPPPPPPPSAPAPGDSSSRYYDDRQPSHQQQQHHQHQHQHHQQQQQQYSPPRQSENHFMHPSRRVAPSSSSTSSSFYNNNTSDFQQHRYQDSSRFHSSSSSMPSHYGTGSNSIHGGVGNGNYGSTSSSSSSSSNNPRAERSQRRVYVGDLPAGTNGPDLGAFFEDLMSRPDFGFSQVKPAVLDVSARPGNSFAFVEFANVDMATALIISMDGVEFRGAALKLRRPKDYIPPTGGPPERDPNQAAMFNKLATPGIISTNVPDGPNKIFVGGLPPYFNAKQVQKILQAYGDLKAFNLVRDASTGNSKGFAFFEYANPEVTENAVRELDQMPVGEHTINVALASSHSHRNNNNNNNNNNMANNTPNNTLHAHQGRPMQPLQSRPVAGGTRFGSVGAPAQSQPPSGAQPAVADPTGESAEARLARVRAAAANIGLSVSRGPPGGGGAAGHSGPPTSMGSGANTAEWGRQSQTPVPATVENILNHSIALQAALVIKPEEADTELKPGSPGPPSKVVVVRNMVDTHSLVDDDVFADVWEDVCELARKHGEVEAVVIPRPPEEDSDVVVPGQGKVFLEFKDSSAAASAAQDFGSRRYAFRTLLAEFYPETEFAQRNLQL